MSGELREQAKVVRWARQCAARAGIEALRWLHHSPNGGVRAPRVGAQMAALGVSPGFPDLILPVRTDEHPGLAIEMKRPDGTGRLTPHQRGWLEHLEANGWRVRVCESADEASEEIVSYLGLDPRDVPSILDV